MQANRTRDHLLALHYGRVHYGCCVFSQLPIDMTDRGAIIGGFAAHLKNNALESETLPELYKFAVGCVDRDGASMPLAKTALCRLGQLSIINQMASLLL